MTSTGAQDDADPRDPASTDPSPRSWWRRRRVRAIGAVVVLAAIVVTVALTNRPADTPVRRAGGERFAPDFELPDLRDERATIELRSLRGRPVVLNFWASWCVPCRKEMPAFQAVHARLGDKVAFLGVNHQDSRDDALDFLRSSGVQYPAAYDPGGKTGAAYALYGMPTTVFVAADGRILATRTGELSEQQLLSAVRDLFGVDVKSG